MLPLHLKNENFASYPPEARVLALKYLPVFKRMPLGFLPSLLRELIDYDYKFPAERQALEEELSQNASLDDLGMRSWFAAFSSLRLSTSLERFDWVNQPAQFLEQLSAYLWTTQQLDSYREAATEYGSRVQIKAPSLPEARRMGIAVIGQGVGTYEGQLFRKLRMHGTYFGNIDPTDGLHQLLAVITGRAAQHAVPYGHWYVDGGQPADHSSLLTSISYQALEPARGALLKNIQAQLTRPGMGPEELRSHLARLSPADLGMTDAVSHSDTVLDRFTMRLMTEGSGTQIYSTAFAQWATREALRRAQPLSMIVRYAPRQRQAPMNKLLARARSDAELDYTGSLIDADMAAFYHWINQQRLPGAGDGCFLAWFEGHSQAIAIGPTMPRNTESHSRVKIAQILSMMTT